jgi:hypothetical protein
MLPLENRASPGWHKSDWAKFAGYSNLMHQANYARHSEKSFWWDAEATDANQRGGLVCSEVFAPRGTGPPK